MSGYKAGQRFPSGSAVKNLPALQEIQISTSGSGRSPGEGNSKPLQFFARESQGQRSLAGYSPWNHRELDTAEHSLNAGLCVKAGCCDE